MVTFASSVTIEARMASVPAATSERRTGSRHPGPPRAAGPSAGRSGAGLPGPTTQLGEHPEGDAGGRPDEQARVEWRVPGHEGDREAHHSRDECGARSRIGGHREGDEHQRDREADLELRRARLHR